jgi:hypothetical protein
MMEEELRSNTMREKKGYWGKDGQCVGGEKGWQARSTWSSSTKLKRWQQISLLNSKLKEYHLGSLSISRLWNHFFSASHSFQVITSIFGLVTASEEVTVIGFKLLASFNNHEEACNMLCGQGQVRTQDLGYQS